jgi:hypothetical protein
MEGIRKKSRSELSFCAEMAEKFVTTLVVKDAF